MIDLAISTKGDNGACDKRLLDHSDIAIEI
jgi:hypothetical protein